jgi:hypothetical protein
MTSPLCFSHFAVNVSSFDIEYDERLTSSTNDEGVNHALGTIHEITELRLPDGQESWPRPAHTDLEA